VRVVRRRGGPASGVRVTCRAAKGRATFTSAADADGVASFADLPEGTFTVSVAEPGFNEVSAQATLGPAGHADLVLTEPACCAPAAVRVVGTDGLPLPFARVAPRGYVAAGDDDVQTLALWTDADGRCLLPNLPTDSGTVRVEFGTRSASASFRSGEVTAVQLEDGAPPGDERSEDR
jgi:hypothetical protein